MGYHFNIDEFSFPENVNAGDEAEIKFTIDNVGVAPIYNKLALKLRLVKDDEVYELDTDIDITKWLPGKSVEEAKIIIPEGLCGEYDIEIGIIGGVADSVAFCTDAESDGEFYKVGRITVE